jgi:L-seryl-tRNA(Ser) seleniumtransferase
VTDARRSLPSVDRLLRSPELAVLAAQHSRALLVRAARRALDAARREPERAPQGADAWAAAVANQLDADSVGSLRACINATGVVLHTNLGRAPLAPTALERLAAAAKGYSTLEYDLAGARRGSRHVHCSSLLAELTGAEDGLVVNNAAAGVLLALAVAAEGGSVLVSRGELVEIGGGFRIPEIMERSGATLFEVGTTNRTRLADYERALGPRGGVRASGRAGVPAYELRGARGREATASAPQVRAILKVHRSNFKMQGFVEEALLEDLVALGRRRKVPVLHDLGGGLMMDLTAWGLVGEPTVQDSVRAGATIVVFSGDKLLGGPQAGVMVGRRAFISKCRAHPLARAARADKLTLAALEATLMLYRDPERARTEVPVLRMLTAAAPLLIERADALARRLPAAAGAQVVRTRAAVGGGAFPGVELESAGVALEPARLSAADLAQRLRSRRLPVIAVVERGRVVLDLRTVEKADEPALEQAVVEALART